MQTGTLAGSSKDRSDSKLLVCSHRHLEKLSCLRCRWV